jgi:hypothetical protein
MNNDCPWTEETVAFGLHALEPDEEEAVRAHLLDCAACQVTLRDTELIANGLSTTVEQVDPPDGLRDAILTGAARTPQVGEGPIAPSGARRWTPLPDAGGASRRREARGGPPSGGPEDGRRRPGREPRWRRRVVGVALAAALIVIGGLAGYTIRLQQQRDDLIAQSQTLAQIIATLGQPGTSYANLTTSEGEPVAAVLTTESERTVVTTGLPANDRAANIYVVWGVSTGAPQPIGTFDVDAPGTEVHSIGPTTGGQPFAGYAISREPGRTAPATPTDVVATGQVQI